jgi:hypothetical protein
MNQSQRLRLVSVATVLAVATLIGLAVALMVDVASLAGYTKSAGVRENLPLAALALFNTFTWLPAFMPLLLPAVIILVALVAAFVYPLRYARHSVEHEQPAAEHRRVRVRHWRVLRHRHA